MARKSMGWMKFRDLRSDQMGVQMIRLPDRSRPEMRGKAQEVPGRHGDLWISDGEYAGITLTPMLRLERSASRDAVSAWLTGCGNLSFSDEPERCYRARASADIRYERFLPGGPLQNLEIEFTCHPFKYESNPSVVTLTADGFVTNPGTMASEPVITLTGSGAVLLAVSGKALQISNVEGSVVIDCEAKTAYKPGDASMLMTGRLSGEWPVFPTGTNPVTWMGNVTSLSIQPNWRWL